MILSFHPCYVADENRICAERPPGQADLERIRAADAVILPQGCKADLYELARDNAAHLFPNYEARFRYPGKTGQIRLFRELDAPHPRTRLYSALENFDAAREMAAIRAEIGFPLVFKLDHGGEGDTVARIDSPDQLSAHTGTMAEHYQGPFLLQQYVACEPRSLRVVIIGGRTISYWRINPDPHSFGTSAARGARIDHRADDHLQRQARQSARTFCERSGINLAGIDLIFAPDGDGPLFLELNHYFGRRGLGGSEAFYEILTAEIDHWLAGLGLGRTP